MAEINRDAEVTRYLNRPVDARSVDAFYSATVEHWDRHGFGFYAVDVLRPEGPLFIGFVGVAHPTFLPALAHRPELGWRLARPSWGQGFASEATAAARDDAFVRLGIPSLISIIHPDNVRSQRVATKLGMSVETQTHNPVLDRQVDVWHLDAPES